jgi:hypothetical protein
MNALASDDLGFRLEQFAAGLRPPEQGFVSVLKIAHRLGSRVYLRFERALPRPLARVDLLAKPPTIYLTRHSSIVGERCLDRYEDHLLSCRERFSVAHELGHIIAYEKFGILPAREKSGYWAQEECMHRFAGALLTPTSIIDRCLNGLHDGEPVSPFLLQESANKPARLSQEVLATQLCLRRPDIGFMKVALIERKRDKKRVLRVLFAKSGKQIFLPNNHSHVRQDYLLSRFALSEVGSTNITSCTFGKEAPQNLNVSWRRAGTLKQTDDGSPNELIPVFWISVASHTRRIDEQLSLW